MKTIIANWKSNKTLSEAQVWAEQFTQKCAPALIGQTLEVVIAPSFPQLSVVRSVFQHSPMNACVHMAVQDMSPYNSGSYTGAVSARNLDGLDIKYALLHHSERVAHFHESLNEMVRKVDQAIFAEMVPVIFVDIPDLTEVFSVLSPSQVAQSIFVFEPVAAIGNGESMEIQKVAEGVDRIRQLTQSKVFYGGSVSVLSVKEYLGVCDGVVVGHHSLNAEDFSALVLAAAT